MSKQRERRDKLFKKYLKGRDKVIVRGVPNTIYLTEEEYNGRDYYTWCKKYNSLLAVEVTKDYYSFMPNDEHDYFSSSIPRVSFTKVYLGGE